MGGHLPDHGDLGHSHRAVLGYFSDCIWVVGFVLAVLLSFFSGITFRYVAVFAAGVLFLIVADPRGIGGILAWPVLAVLCLFTIACLRGWID